MRIVHIYAMKDQPDRVRVVAPRHAAYWHGLDLPGYLGGPFEDRSGGAVSFEADSVEEARRLISADPFVRQDLLESSSVKEWLTDRGAAGSDLGSRSVSRNIPTRTARSARSFSQSIRSSASERL